MGTGEISDAVVGIVARRGAGAGSPGVVARLGLFDRLGGPARVTVVSAPPGSGKTALLRSWISQAGLGERAAWVAAGRDERDPQRFWLSVLGALRRTGPGSTLVQTLTASPELDGWTIVERLLADLASLDEPIWLIIDDAHELGSDQAARQLELFMMRATPRLCFVLATRHDLRLGLHRLRLRGELAEIREADLRFSLAEARELFSAAGVELPASALVMLHQRTEGWAAGLRMAALSLVGHPDPESFATEFSGTERTVAEYLLAEVLDRQSSEVRLLLLRTSVLERVNGELADLLTGNVGGERMLQDLEQANAFVMSLDAPRSWFRYHQMFAELLALELRRTAPAQVAGLHRTASAWFAGHGCPVEAIRHAQAAGDWELAARLLADRWPGLHLDGQAGTVRELLAGFPPEARVADAELAAVATVDELWHGSLEAAARYLGLAERAAASVPDARQAQARLLLGIARLLIARQRGDLPAAAEEARRLHALADTPEATPLGLGEDLGALAKVSFGITEAWIARFADAERHLEQGVALARRIGRPYLELSGLAQQATVGIYRSFTLAADRAGAAVELARRHGWTDEPSYGIACMMLGAVLAWQGRLDEAEPWAQRAERNLRTEAEPAAGMGVRYVRGLLALVGGHDADAVAAFRTALRLAGRLAGPHYLARHARALLLQALVHLGDTEGAEQSLAELDEQERGAEEIRIAVAALRLAQGRPHAATDVLAPITGGCVPVDYRTWQVQAFLLEAIARDELGDPAAAESALERALDVAEPNGALAPFLLNPAPELLERHARHRTAHAALIAGIQDLWADRRFASSAAGPQPPFEPLSESELRVLRYLPTNLSAPEIADELHVSRNTVKSHMRSLYVKLGAHRRTEAVERARVLGLLAPSARQH